MIMLDKNYFTLLKQINWEEVFDIWRQDEASLPNWIKHYQERGFSSWEEWRKTYTEPFKCAESKWNFYQLNQATKIVPDFYGGPFKSWVKHFYQGKDALTFSELINLLDLFQHPGIKRLASNFPKSTVLIGLIVNSKIIIIEGMHRCCAISLKAKKGEELKGDIKIALGKSLLEELPVVGQVSK